MVPPSRLRAWPRRLAKLLLLFILGLALLIGLVLLSINLPPVSRFVAARVNAALEPTFKGRLVLRRLGHVDFGGILGAELEVFDPSGESVLRARDIDVRLFWPQVAWDAAVTSADPLLIPFDRIGVTELEVSVIDDGAGTPTLAHAFEPKQQTEEESSGSTAISVEELALDTLLIRGSLASFGPIDAELTELSASLSNGPRGTQFVLEQLDLALRQLPTVETVSGRLTAHLSLPAQPPQEKAGANGSGSAAGKHPSTQVYTLLPAPEPRRIVANFAGRVAGSTAEVALRMLGEQLEASFDAESISPATLTQLVPGLSPQAPVALSAQLDGALDDLAFAARVQQQAAQLEARGRVQLGEQGSVITARVQGSDLDLSKLMTGGLATHLNLGADARFSFGKRGGEGTYKLESDSSRIGPERLPGVSVDGELRLPKDAPLVATGSVEIAEEGAPTHIQYDVRSSEAGLLAKLSSETRVNRPPRVRELAGVRARGTITTRASFDTQLDQLDAEVNVRLSELRHPTLSARELHASALARGSLEAPALELLANLSGLTASDRTWSRVRVSAQGNTQELAVNARAWGSNPDHVELSAALFPSSERLVRSPELRVRDADGALVVRAAGVNLNGDSIHLDRLTLEGPGRANLSLWYGPGLEKLDLRAEQLDSAALLRIFGVVTPLESARLNLTAEFQNGKRPSGKLLLDVDDLALGKLKRGQVSADLVLRRGVLSGRADVELARGARAQLVVNELTPPLGAITERSLEAMAGEIALQGELDLAELQPLLPLGGIERAAGRVRFDVSGKRPPAGAALPLWRAHIDTQSLVVVEERPDLGQTQSPDQARSSAPLALRGVDLELDAALEEQEARLQVRLFDAKGNLLETAAEWKGIAVTRDLVDARRAFSEAPFTALVTVPPRALSSVPELLRPSDVEGTLQLRATAEGTLADPRLDARLRVERLRPAMEGQAPPGLDVELSARYEKAGGDLQLKAHDRKAALVDLVSSWTGDALRISQAGPESPIVADLDLRIDDLPLETVPLLQNQHIRGKLSGRARLDGYGRDAQLNVELNTDELRVDRLRVDEVRARVSTSGSKLTALVDVSGRGGQANAKLSTGLDWGDRSVPLVDEQLEGAFHARGLRLSALLPLVAGSVSELDGKLDADLRARMQDGTPRLSGSASLKDGALHLPALGQRFHDIKARLAVSPNSIRIEDVSARAVSGGFEASAQAALQGLTPVTANARLSIDEDDKLPLTLEGEAVGDAWGGIELAYRRDEAAKAHHLRVDLEKLNVELPAAPPRGIQNLEQSEHVRVGYWRQDREFVTIPLQPLEEPGEPSEYKTIVVVNLGSMRVEKGQQVEVGLGGSIQATLGEQLDVRGKIETRRGELDISGKTFDIERGSVTFTGGPPDDPIISAVARYDSPVGFTVYAEYTGTAARGKLSLRSEPPLSQDEILTLLLFGTPDGSFGAGGGGSLTTAVGVAGGTAAQGLNRALSDVTDLDVSARVDTSTGAPRPELVVQLTPRVAARVTQALGEPAPGQSPDRTFLTLELRLASAWALSAMVGDRGASALDLIWRRRY